MCMELYITWKTRSLKTENELAPHQAEMRMIRRMCGVKLMDKRSCVELRQRLEDAVKVVQRNRLRWYGLGLTKDDDDWVIG